MTPKAKWVCDELILHLRKKHLLLQNARRSKLRLAALYYHLLQADHLVTIVTVRSSSKHYRYQYVVYDNGEQIKNTKNYSTATMCVYKLFKKHCNGFYTQLVEKPLTSK